VVVVGDALVDVLEGGDRTYAAGGAGFNLAAGVRHLGAEAILACPISQDQWGGWLRDSIEAAGVTLIPLACSQPTGFATSRRVGGEPEYEFSEPVYQRHFSFTPAQAAAVPAGSVLVVNSFPMHDPSQVADLITVVTQRRQILVVDPNARRELLVDRVAYRNGLRRLASRAHVIKLSVQDVADLELGEPRAFAEQLLGLGVRAVVMTRGEFGASVYTADGPVISAPAAARREPVVDTMGAGDATLACLVVQFAAAGGVELDPPHWEDLLRSAMDLAADVCRTTGGSLAAARSIAAATKEGHDR
jgi:fructokinase